MAFEEGFEYILYFRFVKAKAVSFTAPNSRYTLFAYASRCEFVSVSNPHVCVFVALRVEPWQSPRVVVVTTSEHP